MLENWINKKTNPFPLPFHLKQFFKPLLRLTEKVSSSSFTLSMFSSSVCGLALALPEQIPPGSESLVCTFFWIQLQESSGMGKCLSTVK